MSVHANFSNHALKIEQNHLHVGDTKVPIDRARNFWVYKETKEVVVYSATAKKGKEASFTIPFGSTEKVKECIRLLISNSKAHVSIPILYELTTSTNRLAFTFRDDDEAAVFYHYYSTPFFSTDVFESKLDGTRCVVICRSDQTDTIGQINHALQQLDDRLDGHEINKKLCLNKDPNFPGKLYQEEPLKTLPWDNTGERDRHYIVRSNRIERIKWSFPTNQRSTEISNYEEVDGWINMPEHGG
jgi:hypothetical protein